MKTKFYATMVLLLVMLILAACSGSASQAVVDLEGSSWILAAYRQTIPIELARPTLAFADGQVSGIASCNNYGGSYQVDGDRISFGPMFMTEMYCMEPEGIMEQEALYLQMLGSAERFEIRDGQLVIFMLDGETLTFDPAE